jgi:hypothetical protein
VSSSGISWVLVWITFDQCCVNARCAPELNVAGAPLCYQAPVTYYSCLLWSHNLRLERCAPSEARRENFFKCSICNPSTQGPARNANERYS